MNIRADLKMTKPEFLRFLTDLERQGDRSRLNKYEWTEGRVVQMPNVTRDHGRVVRNIFKALEARLDDNTWEVFVSDFGVEGETFVRFPDIVVEPAGGDGKGRRAEAAIILAEVLSTHSANRDLVEKPAQYFTFPSLEVYIVAAQDEAIVWIWQRRADGTVPDRPDEVKGRDAAITLTARAITLSLDEIYRGTKSE